MITRIAAGSTVDTDGISVKINNGDLEALNNLVQNLNFANQEAILRFVIAVLVKAGSNGVYVDENGTKIRLTPNNNLLKQTPLTSTPVQPQ